MRIGSRFSMSDGMKNGYGETGMNQIYRFLVLSGCLGLIALGVSGCLDLESSNGTPAASLGTVAFNVQPVKGPFSKVNAVRGFALKSGSQVQSFTVSSTAPAEGIFQVVLPKSYVQNYDQVVLEYDGAFSGDKKADGSTLSGDWDIRSFRQTLDASTIRTAMSTTVVNDVLGLRFDGGVVDHLATSLALQKAGVLVSNAIGAGRTAGTSFAADLVDLKAKTSSQLGVNPGASEAERKIAEKLLVARLLKAVDTQNITTASFDEFFLGFTGAFAQASDPGSILVSSPYLGAALTEAEAANVDSGATSVVDLGAVTRVVDFNKKSLIQLSLSHFPQVRTEYSPSRSVYSVSLSFSGTSATWMTEFVVAEDGKVYQLKPGNAPVRSRMGSPMSTDSVLFSIFSTDVNVAADKVSQAVVRFGEATINIGSGTGIVSSGTQGTMAAPNLNSSAMVMLTTPSNRDGAINGASSSHGIWFTTNTSFTSGSRTALGEGSLNYFVTTTAGVAWLLKDTENPETRGNQIMPHIYHGLDFLTTQNARVLPARSDIRSGVQVYLTGDHPFSAEMAPDRIKSLAFAEIPLASGNVSSSVGLTSIASSERLSAVISISGNQLLVTAPRLGSAAQQQSRIPVRASTGVIVMADAGIRYGNYAITAHQGEAVMFAAAFSVDQDGKVYSHGGMNAATSAFNYLVAGVEMGSVTTGFSLSLDSSTLSTMSFSGRLQELGGSVYMNKEANPPVPDAQGVASVIAGMKTTGNLVFMLHHLSPFSLNHEFRDKVMVKTLLGSVAMGGFNSASTQASLMVTESFAWSLSDIATNLSFLLASPTNASSSDETAGFWLLPEAAGTSVSSTAVTTRMTDGVTSQMLDAGFKGNVPRMMICVDGSGCFDHQDVWGWSGGYERDYGHSRWGLDFIRPATAQNLISNPTNLQSGQYSLEVYWNPFPYANDNGRKNGVRVASMSIPTTGTSMILTPSVEDLPSVRLSY